MMKIPFYKSLSILFRQFLRQILHHLLPIFGTLVIQHLMLNAQAQ